MPAASAAIAFAVTCLAEKDALVTLDHGVAREPQLQEVLTGARHAVGVTADAQRAPIDVGFRDVADLRAGVLLR